MMLKTIERFVREFRDERIIKPLLQTKQFKRQSSSDLYAGIIDLGDHKLAVDLNDKIIGDAVRNDGGWFKQETLDIFSHFGGRKIFIDVGANIGTQTVYALKFGGFERAICFEPMPKNISLLKANLALNDLLDRVTIVEAAVGSQPGTASLFIQSDNSGAGSFVMRHAGENIQVPIVTAEAALLELGVEKQDIGLVWIDVEGFEGEVLKGWPSLAGVPLCLEYSPELRKLPPDVFSGWSGWADAREASVQWRPLSTLDLASYTTQADLLLR